jgi:predicted phage-related endonuclease
MDLDEVGQAYVAKLAAIRAQKKALTEAEERAKDRLREYLGSDEVGEVDGTPVVRVLTITSNRLDTTRLKAEKPEIAAAYTKASESTRIEIGDRAVSA